MKKSLTLSNCELNGKAAGSEKRHYLLLFIWVFLLAVILVALFFIPLNPNEIYHSAKAGDLEEVKSYIERNPRLIDKRDQRGATLLYHAVKGNSGNIAQYLIASGASVNTKDNAGLTPLHIAAARGNGEMVRLLIENSADITLKTNSGWTPLSVARMNGHPELEIFLSRKANP